ncbi:chemotaxis protein CheW [Kaarinaea lacus]
MSTSTARSAVEDTNVLSSDLNVNKNQYLTFILAGEEYGVDILRVQEIKDWDSVTKIPNAPAYIKGVMNLRGAIVPIIDLRQRFNLERLEYGPMTVVVVLRVENEDKDRTMGIVVDAVSDVYDIANEHMKPPPDFGEVISIQFLKALATVDDKMVMILDIDHLLTSNEIAFLGSAANHRTTYDAGSLESSVSPEVPLLEASFSKLAPRGEELVHRFYEELFARYPDVQPLFAHLSMKEQETKLLAALKLVVGNLRNPAQLTETLQNLGKRHKGYGANASLYQAVGNTLIDVLKEVSGSHWTEEVNQAWTNALHSIANTMLSAAGE